MKIHTETGSVYEFNGDLVRRTSDHGMRRDEEWLRFAHVHPVAAGESMRMELEPLGWGGTTIRITSPVTRIEP